ncbi:MAG: hypothetical protein AB1390_10115 [Nitrospirota bacterium]
METIAAPDYAAAITGWRFWKIRKSPGTGSLWLRSVTRRSLWPPMERFEAYHTSYRESNQSVIEPEIHSRCGIYAYKSPADALRNLDRCCYRGTILGKVHLWGVIQRHEFGYRSQFAYPVSLDMGVCCMCKRVVHLGSEPFAIGWASYHFSESFSVSGLLCEVCNEKYYSLETEYSFGELAQLSRRYGITIG